MKKIKIYLVTAMLLIFTVDISSFETKAQPRASVNFQFFYDNLSPYGTWISYPQYGYVWHPNAGRGFHPYRTRGHWAWSDEYGWIWISDYEWGWAAFHYGRWHYDPYYGWLWIPDYDWAPAWVVWRGGGDYYGWAPLDAGINISISFGSYSPPANYWCFAPRRYITSPVIYNYYVSPQQNTTIINNTTIIKNYSVNGGPARNVFVNGPQRTEAERYTNQTIRPVKLRESSRPERTTLTNNEMVIYKPKVNAGDKSSARPSKVVPYEKTNKAKGAKVTEPVKKEPVRNEPTRTQPVKKESVQNEPTRTQPVKKEPVRSEPTRTQPVKKEPVRNEPARSQPVKKEPIRNEPARNQPVKKEPIRNEPPRTQPVKKEPVHNKPVKNEPARNQASRNQPVKNQPVKNQQPKGQEKKKG
jgi:hypothetical protein